MPGATRKGNPHAQVTRRLRRRRRCSPRTTCARRCAATTSRRSPTARARSCIARADKARELCERPGVDHRLRPPHRVPLPGRSATSTTSPSTRSRPRPPGSTTAPVEVAELQAAFTHEEPLLVEALGLGDDVRGEPVGRPARRQPDHGHRPRAASPRPPTRSATAAGTARSRTRRRVRACSRTWSASWRGIQVSHQPCAIVGIGQTHHKTRRRDVSFGGLVREAAFRALDDAHMTWRDIDAVVLGKAPDLFEGVMKPELYLTDALGAAGKPMFRVHTAGSVGGTTGIVAVAPRRGRPAPARARGRVREAVGGQRAVRARLAARARRSAPAARSRRSCARYIAPHRRARATSAGWSRSRTGSNALKNPYAHLKIDGHLASRR